MDYDLWLRFAGQADPAFIPQRLANFRWHAGSKTGARYAIAAWECLQVARRRADPGERVAVAQHFLHYLAQTLVYRVLDLVGSSS